MKYIASFIILIFLIIFVGSVDADDLYIAMLEQPQCKNDSDFMIRVLFAKRKTEWVSFDINSIEDPYSFSKIKWIAAFDGRNIGRVQIMDPKNSNVFDNAYSSSNFFQIKQGLNIPSVLNKSEEFGGWCNPPKFRPLVLVSKTNFKDPAKWRPFSPLKEICIQLFPELQKIAGKVDKCLIEGGSNPVPYDYQAQDLILYKSYQNALGQKLISIGLDPKVYKCDGIIEPQWKPYWFLIDKQIRYIGNELALVDAGDYDKDGKSEVIFWHSGYNEDGYTIFYNDFNDRVDFFWKYH